MTFDDAEAELERIAGERDCAINYGKFRFGAARRSACCLVWVAGLGNFEGHTWRAALAKLADAMHGDGVSAVEAPGEELGAANGGTDGEG